MFPIADILIILLVALSTLMGLNRGLIRELLSLLAWTAAILMAMFNWPIVADWLRDSLPDEPTRRFAAITLIFVPALVFFSLFNGFVSRYVLRNHRDSHDQLLGLLFGALRGVVIVAIAVVLGRASALDSERWWQESNFIPQVDQIIAQARPYLPAVVTEFLAENQRPQITRKLTLHPNANGQYQVHGEINGVEVEFLLDTGASLVMLPQSLADRLGLRRGKPIQVVTALGPTTAYEVELASIRIGSIEVKLVRGAINPAASDDQVLLGTSFLRYIHYRHENNSLVLEQTRYLEGEEPK